MNAGADAGSANWIDTWSASPQPDWGPDFFAPAGIPRSLRDQTIRQVARVSQGGDRIRVEFSNEYGEHPLVIGEAHVAQAGEDGAIVPGSNRVLTFGGEGSVIVRRVRRSGAIRSIFPSRILGASRSASTCPRSPPLPPGTTTPVRRHISGPETSLGLRASRRQKAFRPASS